MVLSNHQLPKVRESFLFLSFCKITLITEEKKEAIIWGPTGVEPWSASMITGIDWKSLTIPASLPTTFDVVPSAEELQRDYTHNSYTLIHALPPQHEYDRKKKHMHNGSGTYEKIAA
jgi:hypothetical protein